MLLWQDASINCMKVNISFTRWGCLKQNSLIFRQKQQQQQQGVSLSSSFYSSLQTSDMPATSFIKTVLETK